MSAVFQAMAQYWWLVFVFGGTIGGAVRAVGAWNERRAQRSLERYRIKHETKAAIAQAESRGRVDAESVKRELARAVADHQATDDRWFAYETDLSTVLDFPMLIDMREPLTVEFHRTRSRAELLRPAGDDVSPDAVEAYRDAVHDYRAALEVAEKEARRRRRGDFDQSEQERLARAQRLLDLAGNDGASPSERQQAYARARRELDGLIDLPTAGSAELEEKLRLALESGGTDA
ncbi:hypothetical protein [Gordonia sp. (in: high G+C Gram-positive bacteria)]|uniref:hypothetical protein n=1 Tax=Gordonia sp. (in: high G+C Gram-positive bacteria) TaxID=84139 RepID=UPI0016A544E6|nr:hypothetical protein [Gordonia sp. (in: high G+C Gram-positive bacteria)]NLG45308.1 hypothetical protein [Gordonia sp. (in: high G+C Gram-positive bacteria)]